MNLQEVFIALAIDIVLMCVLAWYVSAVHPGMIYLKDALSNLHTLSPLSQFYVLSRLFSGYFLYSIQALASSLETLSISHTLSPLLLTLSQSDTLSRSPKFVIRRERQVLVES